MHNMVCLTLPSISVLSIAAIMAIPTENPEFTNGGSRAADIATPTRLDVLFPSTDKATPIPDGRAINSPINNDSGLPLIRREKRGLLKRIFKISRNRTYIFEFTYP